MSRAHSFWIALAAVVAHPSAAMAHPDIATRDGMIAYLVASLLAAALFVVGGIVYRLSGRKSRR